MSAPRFIIAMSAHQASLTAEQDWGWERGPQRHTWMDHDSSVVRYVSHREELFGLRETTIYLGYRWYVSDVVVDCGGESAFRAFCSQRDITISDKRSA